MRGWLTAVSIGLLLGCASVDTVKQPSGEVASGPQTVADCIDATEAFYNKQWERTFDTAQGSRTTLRDAQVARRQFALNCVSHVAPATPAPDSILPDLATLYSMIGEESLARTTVMQSVQSPQIAPGVRARQLVQAVQIFTRDSSGLPEAQRYLHEIEVMGENFLPSRLRGMLAVLTLYQRSEWVDRAIAYGDSIMALEPVESMDSRVRPASFVRSREPGEDMTPADSVRSLIAQALLTLANINADAGRGNAAVWYTERVLSRYRDTPQGSIAYEVMPRMRLLNRPAPTVSGEFWLNPKASNRAFSPEQGKVTLVMFTTYWCETCAESAKAFERLHQQFNASGNVQFIIATHTATIRPANERRPKPISIKAQVASIDSAFVRRMGVTMPIAIEAVDTAVAVSTGETDNEHRYQVDGYPTFAVIDATGRVKWLTTGWGERVEGKLARWISELRPHTTKP